MNASELDISAFVPPHPFGVGRCFEDTVVREAGAAQDGADSNREKDLEMPQIELGAVMSDKAVEHLQLMRILLLLQVAALCMFSHPVKTTTQLSALCLLEAPVSQLLGLQICTHVLLDVLFSIVYRCFFISVARNSLLWFDLVFLRHQTSEA